MHKGFNYSQDGPGNRLVYHLQGCNLHCPWCSNPESMKTVKYGGISVEDMAKQIAEEQNADITNEEEKIDPATFTQEDVIKYILVHTKEEME